MLGSYVCGITSRKIHAPSHDVNKREDLYLKKKTSLLEIHPVVSFLFLLAKSCTQTNQPTTRQTVENIIFLADTTKQVIYSDSGLEI